MIRTRPWLVRLALATAVLSGPTGCDRPGPEVAVDQLPPAAETLRIVRARLGRSYSERRLTALAASEASVLQVLRAPERRDLGRDWIRFRLDRPAEVLIAVPEGSVPFWLADGGFRETTLVLDHPDGRFRLYREPFEAGWVGLGVNGLDRSSTSHYAVFVRGGASVTDLSPGDLEMATVDASAGASVPVRPFVDDDSPFASIPAELDRAVVVRTRKDDRHASALFRDRAWKTRIPSARRADQVVVAFGADASRSLSWTWRTEPAQSSTRLRLARASESGEGPIDPGTARVVEGTSALLEVPDLVNDPVTRRHRVIVDDLEPATRYVYSIEDGSKAGSTPWRPVMTGPASGTAAPFTFIYLGDPQTGFPEWGRLLESARRRTPESAFLMIAGDLVDRGPDRTNWDHFFHRAAGVFDVMPMMPAVGNHEYLDGGPRIYRATFSTPENGPMGLAPGLAYSFTYGDAQFVVLDSEAAIHDDALARSQADWIEATLAGSSASWKFAMFHHPLYASHPTRDQPALRDLWAPIFAKHGVALVMQGHDHAYLRTYPLDGEGRPAHDEATGTTYVLSVSGDKYYGQRPRPETSRGMTEVSTYQVIRVDPGAGRLEHRAFDVSGAEVDAYEIRRPVSFAKTGTTEREPTIRD